MSTLCLFSSNIRPLYEQDILDVLAAMPGQIFRFRYESQYVDNVLRQSWENNCLIDRKVLVLYSIQQPRGYHSPAFIPIRHARVVRSSKIGSIYFIEFRLSEYAVLPALPGDGDPGPAIRKFTTTLEQLLPGHPGSADPPRYSATVGSLGNDLFDKLEAPVAFERVVTYLAGTVSFASHLLWRVSEIRELGKGAVIADGRGRFRLYLNRTYEMTLSHFQPVSTAFGIRPAALEISTDPALVEIVGEKCITLGSRYDAVPIRLRATSKDTRETIVNISPINGTLSPRTEVRLIVGPAKVKRFLGLFVAALIVFLAAVPGLMDESATFSEKIIFPLLAGVLTVALGYFALPART